MGFSIAVSEDASARLPAPLGYSANAHSAVRFTRLLVVVVC